VQNDTLAAYIHKLEDLLLVSVPADLTDTEVKGLRGQILDGIDRYGSRWVLLDFSRVPICDSFFGRVIMSLAELTKLKGAGVIVSGLQNEVIITMVTMGLTLDSPHIHTALSLDDALAMSRALREREEAA
jgi:rsbT antagonist protein RsbS